MATLTQIKVKVDNHVPITMRDGTILYADVYRPDDNEKHPVVLVRAAYDKSNIRQFELFNPLRAANNGYVTIYMDCRGTLLSGGEFSPFREGNDGYDSVEWAAAQPWSNGKVGMAGASYLAITQWTAAREQPPHLVTIIPNICYSDMHDQDVFYGGAFTLMAAINWGVLMQGMLELVKRKYPPEKFAEVASRLIKRIDNLKESYEHVPLKTLPALKEDGISSFYFEWLEHPDYDEYWEEINFARYERINVPIFQIGGWYDCTIGGTVENFVGMQEKGGTEVARKNQRMLIGPWFHWVPQNCLVGELNTGIASAASTIDLMGMQLKWFDYWLKGVDNGITQEPPVRIFVMGENKWRNEKEWPLARTIYQNYYLHSNGRANTLNGDGVLSTQEPANEPTDHFLYDPKNPVPTKGGAVLGPIGSPTFAGPFDHSDIEKREDILVYTTEVLEQDMEVTGPVKVKLYASTSAKDTDFTAKLLDVWPDGRAFILADGIKRARYRESTKKQVFIEPGKVYEYEIDLWATSIVFQKGHKVRVEISSSNFPRFDRNHNIGGVFGEEVEMVVALQTIHHNEEFPSHIVLPIIPRG